MQGLVLHREGAQGSGVKSPCRWGSGFRAPKALHVLALGVHPSPTQAHSK